MEIENPTLKSVDRPMLPLWATIPLYILSFFLFTVIFGGFMLIPLSIIPKSDAIYYVIAENFVYSLTTLIAAWACALIFLRYIDRCPLCELGMEIRNRWKDCLLGILFAVVIYLIGFGVNLQLGAIKITDIVFDFTVLAGSFFVFFVSAASEEIMVRGYIQGRLMTKINKFAAMVIASLIFSLMHIPNPNIGLFPLFNLFLAGLLLGASYMYTRNLWFPIALHTAWNWIQGPVLGYEVSGTNMFPSMFQLQLSEENLLNGGRFGFEGSIICTILIIIGTFLIIWWHERFLKPHR